MSDERIILCKGCQYDLSGLPERAACPECWCSDRMFVSLHTLKKLQRRKQMLVVLLPLWIANMVLLTWVGGPTGIAGATAPSLVRELAMLSSFGLLLVIIFVLCHFSKKQSSLRADLVYLLQMFLPVLILWYLLVYGLSVFFP